ncbi:hypothetical protein V8G54_021921, partial [Vigna mungo]
MRYLTTCLHLLVVRKIVSYMLSFTVTQRFCNVCERKRVSQNPNSVPNTIFPCFKLLQKSVRVSEAVTTISKLHSLRRKENLGEDSVIASLLLLELSCLYIIKPCCSSH